MSRYKMTITLEVSYEAQRHKNMRAAGYALMRAALEAPSGADSLLRLLGLAIMPEDVRLDWLATNEQLPSDLEAFIRNCRETASIELEDMGEDGLCDDCQHRANSQKAVAEYMQRNPEGGGLVNDIAPKAECKLHRGYGRPIENKGACRDFLPLEV